MLFHVIHEEEKIVMDLGQDSVMPLLLCVLNCQNLLKVGELGVGDPLHLLGHADLL